MRRTDPRGIRKTYEFLQSRHTDLSSNDEFVHEAQISFLLTGVDEWFWTALCCIETFHEDRSMIEDLYKSERDAPSGGTKRCHVPTWNPREYYLAVAASRMRQVRGEWENILVVLEERLAEYVWPRHTLHSSLY